MGFQRGKAQLEVNFNHRITDFKDEIYKEGQDQRSFEPLGTPLTDNNQDKKTL